MLVLGASLVFLFPFVDCMNVLFSRRGGQEHLSVWHKTQKQKGFKCVCAVNKFHFVFILGLQKPTDSSPFLFAHGLDVLGIQMPHYLHLLLFLFFLCASLDHCEPVTTAQDLIRLFNNTAESTLNIDIELLADLNFDESNLTLPLGASPNGTCVAFSGTFQGNGHSIKGLKMNNTGDGEYKHAGLFCTLKDATVENLVIDSSCSFTGESVGALSVLLNGSLTVTHTINKAVVSGNHGVGGFIGYVEDLEQQAVVSFRDCTNDGNVTAKGNNVGGFVGSIFNASMVLTISDSTNNGFVTSNGNYIGGFVGYISNSKNITMAILNSVNNGNVTGGPPFVGGFVGHILKNTDMEMTILNSTNNGVVTCNGSYGNNVGGFIGSIYSNMNMNMIISNSINNGNVTGNSYAGGFVGQIYSSWLHSLNIGIINSANKGCVSVRDSTACGFVCVDSNCNNNVTTKIINSINKGSVNANTYPYGITSIITKARNVVSMGEVTGSSHVYTFWDPFVDVDLFYGLDDNCVNCSTNATLIQQNTDTRFYEAIETGEHVHDLLNDEAVNKHFGLVWSSKLELVDKVTLTVNVSGLLVASICVESGTQLSQISNFTQFFDDKYGIVSVGNKPRTVYNSTHLVSRNMSVMIVERVNVFAGAPINKNELLIPGEKLDQVANAFGFSLDDFIVMNGNEVLNAPSMIETDVMLRLCHNVNVSGVFSASLIIEHGTKLSHITEVSKVLTSSHIIYNQTNKSQLLGINTQVLHDMNIVIVNGSKQEIVIILGDATNATAEDIKNAITDMVSTPDDEGLWIEVVEQDDGSFLVSVVQTNEQGTDVGGMLTECIP